MKKYTLVFSAVLLLTPFLALAQTTLPSAGLTPESSFYFLDRLGEAIREFLTLNPEAKARLQITFAAERVAEIKIILETKGVEAKGLAIAESHLQTHLANAAIIVINQKSEGKNVNALAKELDDKFDGPKLALKETFKTEKSALEVKEKELKSKLREARQAGDSVQIEALIKELGDIKAQKELLELKKDEQEEALEQEEEKIEREMEKKEDAEKAIKEAEEERREIVVMDGNGGDDMSKIQALLLKFDKLLAQAKELFLKENYVGAKQLAKQAEKSLDALEDAIEDLEEAKEKEDELKEKQEEKEREAKEEREEKVKEGVKKEAQRLDKEQRKAREEAQKAEERLRETGEMKEEEENKEIPLPVKPEAPTATVRVAQKWTIEIKGGQFSPAELKIRKGDTVAWTNRDSSLAWPASAFHPTHQVYPGFDALRGLNTGEIYSFTFDKIGSWKYHNHLNPPITGVVEVSE